MNVIISIKPQYVKEILLHTKQVEFRKQMFKKDVERIYVYSSAPCKHIILYFTLERVEKDTPINLWNKFKNYGGVRECDFFKYYQNKDVGYALVFKELFLLKKPIDPFMEIPGFVPPQSFRYLDYELEK